MTKLPSAQELELSELTGIFLETCNPAAAWLAYHLARKHNLPVPDIITAEIDRFAAEVAKPALAAWQGDRRAKIEAKAVAQAWGCTRGKEPAEGLLLSRRNSDIVCDYWERLRDGSRPTDALAVLADEYNLSHKEVERILTASRKVFGRNDPARFDG